MQIEKPKVSRQRLWQIRKKAEGKCMTCGDVRDPLSATHCTKHLNSIREHKGSLPRKVTRPLHVFPKSLWSRALDQFLTPIADDEQSY